MCSKFSGFSKILQKIRWSPVRAQVGSPFMPTSLCVGEGRACPVVNVSTQSHLHLVHADGLAMRVQGEESVEGLDVVVHIIHIKEGDRPSCAASQLKVIVRINEG